MTVKLFLYNRELWREEAAIEQSMQNTREELSKTERNLRSTVSKVCIFEHLILHVHCAVFWPSYFCLNCQFFMMHDCESSVRNNLSWSYSVALEIQFVLLHFLFYVLVLFGLMFLRIFATCTHLDSWSCINLCSWTQRQRNLAGCSTLRPIGELVRKIKKRKKVFINWLGLGLVWVWG